MPWVGLVVAAGCAPVDPCASPEVPVLADGVHVVEPVDADPRVRALSGEWAGRWAGARDARLVVEAVDGDVATIVYGTATYAGLDDGVARSTARVDPGVLTFSHGDVAFRFELVGDALLGTYAVDGRVASTIDMRRCPAR